MGRGKESSYKWFRSHDQDGSHVHIYILNAKNLAPLSISIFSGSKLITSNFSVIQMVCPCRRIIFVTNSNA